MVVAAHQLEQEFNDMKEKIRRAIWTTGKSYKIHNLKRMPGEEDGDEPFGKIVHRAVVEISGCDGLLIYANEKGDMFTSDPFTGDCQIPTDDKDYIPKFINQFIGYHTE